VHASICDYIADLVQNSIEAGASHINLEISTDPQIIQVIVTDNGKGMDADKLKIAVDPFFTEAGKHDHRKIGLGLALLKQTVEAVNGSLKIESAAGCGTTVNFTLDARHLDTPPLGDIAGTVMGLFAFAGDYDLQLTRKSPHDEYSVSRSQLIEALGDLKSNTNLTLARDFIISQEKDLII